MHEEGPDLRGVGSGIKFARLLRCQRVSSEQFLPVAPAAASHKNITCLRHKIRSVLNQIGVNAKCSSKRSLDLFGRIIFRAETACRNLDELPDRGSVYESGLPDLVSHF